MPFLNPLFGVVVGIDGSGKSALMDELRKKQMQVKSWTDLRGSPGTVVLAPQFPTEIRNRLSPLMRAMFIGGHLVAEYETLVRPGLERGESVLFDSYYFKLMAKEALYGIIHPIFFDLCKELPRPDMAFLLDVDPVEAYHRKNSRLSPYEYLRRPTMEDFVSFETRLKQLIESYLSGIPTIHINGMNSLEIVIAEILPQLEQAGFRVTRPSPSIDPTS